MTLHFFVSGQNYKIRRGYNNYFPHCRNPVPPLSSPSWSLNAFHFLCTSKNLPFDWEVVGLCEPETLQIDRVFQGQIPVLRGTRVLVFGRNTVVSQHVRHRCAILAIVYILNSNNYVSCVLFIQKNSKQTQTKLNKHFNSWYEMFNLWCSVLLLEIIS